MTSHEERSPAESPPASPVEQVAHSHVPFWVIVAIACAAQFMAVLDTSIVNVALPAMKTGLGLSTTGQQWVVDGYLITFGGFLLFAARASDLFGRKWVFQAGLVVFTGASLAGGLAQDPAATANDAGRAQATSPTAAISRD
jgi:MFS family permease